MIKQLEKQYFVFPSLLMIGFVLHYNFYKTFNGHPQYSLSFANRYADWGPGGLEKDCTLTVFDREANKEIVKFLFNDYIENGFCSGDFLFVELMQKNIVNSGYSKSIESRSNHRIEIYDLETKKKVNVLPLVLSKKTDENSLAYPLYELAYVDNEKIYLRILENGSIISMNYYHQVTKCPLDEFFINDLEDENKASHSAPVVTPLSNQENAGPIRQNSASFLNRIKNYVAQFFYLSLKLFLLFKSIA